MMRQTDPTPEQMEIRALRGLIQTARELADIAYQAWHRDLPDNAPNLHAAIQALTQWADTVRRIPS